ncbi:threonine/serine exporter family protein [Mycolicibacterium palauense]|uniref:threonine/serine ThrE exporter family protein n=1 Tax=Mycolicibacterium palauense TaxID=2034511 RepID=UPI000BFF107A|nr:threonine/serine exporter family protein [Mycolicibacterium palauense]
MAQNRSDKADRSAGRSADRNADRLRRGLQVALRGRRDPAPVAGQRRRSATSLGDLHTRKVLDLTIRLAEVMLSSGSGTADVQATAQDVAQAYQLNDCLVEIFVTTVIVSALPTTDSPPVTIVRTVQARSTDYTRLAELDRLVQRITSGGVTVDQAHVTMDELTERPHPYPRWMATAGWAGFSLGIALLLGGTWLTCVLAAVSATLIDRTGRLLNRFGTPFFFQHVVGAMIATLVAVAAYYFAGQGPTALVATGIMMLLSGMTLVGSMQDAVTGYMLTAVARLGDALFLTAGIVVGILAGLQVATLIGVVIELHVDATETFVIPTQPWQIGLAVLGAALAGAALTVASYAPLRSVATAGVAAGLAELVLIGLGTAGFGQVTASGIAAILVGLLATFISIRRQAPALVTATAGIMPMLPGLAVFRAVFYLAVDEEFGDGLTQMVAAAAVALALGSGVVLGEFLGSPLRYRAGRVGEFLRVEGPPGLRRAVGNVVHLRPAEDGPPTGSGSQYTRSVALEPEQGSPDDDTELTDQPGNEGEGDAPR